MDYHFCDWCGLPVAWSGGAWRTVPSLSAACDESPEPVPTHRVAW